MSNKFKDKKFDKKKPPVEDGKDSKDKEKFGKPRGKRQQYDAPKRNEPAFYTKYKELAENAARIAFNHRNGAQISYQYGATADKRNIDPIFVLSYIPTPGISINMASGINVAANACYKVLNRKYRGSQASRYQSSDLGIAQFALLDFYLSLAQAERVYGLAQEAKVNQKQLPRELLVAFGYDYNDITDNLADFRASLNKLIVRAESLCLVRGFSLLDHHMFLLSNIFKDKDTARGQYFGYRKYGYWKWNPTLFTSGSALEWKDCHNYHFTKITRCSKAGTSATLFTWRQRAADIIADLTDQLEALLTDSDIDQICSDILAYFGNEDNNPGLVKLSSVPEDYKVSAIYSVDALKQLHNTVITNDGCMFRSTRVNPTFRGDITNSLPEAILPTGYTATDYAGLHIYQNNGVINFNVTMLGTGTPTPITYASNLHFYSTVDQSSYAIPKPIIDTDELNPTPDAVMEMTRQVVTMRSDSYTSGGNTYYYSNITSMGTFLCIAATLFEFKEVGVNTIDSNGDLVFASSEAVAVSICTNLISDYAAGVLSKFDWAPIVNINNANFGKVIFADLDNYREVDADLMEKINDAAVLSEFHNPVSDVLIKDE